MARNEPLTPEGPCPIARPVGSDSGHASDVARGGSGRTRGTNTPPLSSPAGSGRVGRRQRARLAAELSERDRLVLARLWEHRYLTTRQIEAFVFTGHASADAAARTTRRVLARLSRDHLIRSLARRVGGVRAGSAATTWQVAPAGARLVQPDVGRGWRTHEPSERFLDHCLAVADAHLALRDGRQYGRTVSVQTEPLSWRRYLGPGGERRLVRPDLAAVIGGEDHDGAFEDRWFLEIDLGTESLPTLLSKCRAYHAYYQSGSEQTASGSFPQVLWVLQGPRAAARAAELQRRLVRTARLEPRLFRVCLADELPAVLWGTNPSGEDGP